MKKTILGSIGRFLLSIVLATIICALFGIIDYLIMTILDALHLFRLYWILLFFFYIVVLNLCFYGRKADRRRYIASLDKTRPVTIKEDFLAFFKGEGLTVILSYVVFATLRFFVIERILNYKSFWEAFIVIPTVLGNYVKGHVVWGWLICVSTFIIAYCAWTVFRRWKLREKYFSPAFHQS